MSSSAQIAEFAEVVGDVQHPTIKIELQYLQNRVDTLERQLQKALDTAIKKEAYANTLAIDLEHILVQLKRLEIVKQL